MINKYDKDRMEIRFLLDEENNYTEGLKKVNILENKLNKHLESIDKDDLWYIYYDKALIFFKFKDYSKMLSYANMAKLYYETENEKNLISWLLVEYYKDDKSKIQECLTLYDEIQESYMNMGKPLFASSIRVNKAALLCNTEAIRTEIEFIKTIDITNIKMIDECYIEIFNIYMIDVEKNRLEIERIIKLIHNNDLKHTLKSQVLMQCKIA